MLTWKSHQAGRSLSPSQSLELCPVPVPALPSLQTPKGSSAPTSHPTEIFLTDFPGEGFSCSASWSTGNNSPPSSFQNPLFKESCSQLMVFQFSQGFLPHRAFSQKIIFFPYLLYSPQFLLCFNFPLAYFKVLKLEAKWASMSSEGQSWCMLQRQPQTPQIKKSVKHHAVMFKVCSNPTPCSNPNSFPPTKFSYFRFLLVIVNTAFPFLFVLQWF